MIEMFIWREVDPQKPMPKFPCLVTEGPNDLVQFATDANEYWTSKYWFPYPEFPLSYYAIATNEAGDALIRTLKK